MAQIDLQGTKAIRRRIFICGAFFLLPLAIVMGRAIHLQLTLGKRLGERARNQYFREIETAPRRGPIVDRNGAPLATSVDADSVYVVPRLVKEAREKNPEAVSEKALARALHMENELDVLHKRINGPGSFRWIKRRISNQESAALRALNLEKSGILTVREFRRFYPGKRLAAHVVGTVGIDEDGMEGVEKAEDEMLSGESHAVHLVRDVMGNLLEDANSQAAQPGAKVVLTIDSAIQQTAEEALAAEMISSRSQGGMVVAMDPKTGAILALASAPNFNPNAPGDVEGRRNRPVIDAYEPGSVIKCFLLAGAISDKLVTPETPIEVSGGELHIGKKTIHDAHHSNEQREPVREVLAKSSNVGAARIGLMMGPERLIAWLKAFGFGERPGLGLPGESPGVLQNPARMGEIATATTAFGQGMTASAVQVAAALSSIANGGRLMRPYVVQRAVQADGTVILDRKPEMVRQVLTPQAASTVATMMVGVTEKGGTGVKAAIPGVEVAGKTGTAQKADPVTHKYGGKRFSSFMGFLPAEDPKIAIYVAFDDPQGEKYGGDVAAPVFKSVAMAALLQLGVTATAPVALPSPMVAANKKHVAPVKVETEELDEGIDEAAPDDDVPAGVASVQVPDLKNISARSALRVLRDRSLDAEIDGFGRVLSQEPAAGRHVAAGSRVHLTLGAG